MAANVEAIKAAQARGWTTGVVPPRGAPLPLRLEIDDFIQDTELANLYFLAMNAFMSDEASRSPFSYYEISGIHGQPNRAWNRGPQSPEWPDNGSRYSYCAHSSLIFPTWHRAYLAQFEQGLYVHAAALAPALRAERVLERFRIPYFDPLLPRQLANGRYTYGIPIIMTLPEINVKRTADGPWTPMPNPLYSFRFNDAARRELDFRNWSGLRNPSQQTMRAYDFQRDRPNHQVLMQAFDNLYNPINNLSSPGFDTLYRVMVDERQTWVTMSNSARSNDLGMNSLEGFHDNLHVQLAWGLPGRPNGRAPLGHMSTQAFAAFDPSFWLHHCNVDRLLSIWQGLRSEAPESTQWWSAASRPRNDRNPAFWTRLPETDLVPFVKEQVGNRTVYWNSRDVRDHRALGYEYPETAAARRATGESYVNALRRWANSELGWLGRPSQGGSPQAIAKLNDSLVRNIPFFPKRILIDGEPSRPLATTQSIIGSRFVAAPPPPPPAPRPGNTTRGFSAAPNPPDQQFAALSLAAATTPAVPATSDSKPEPATVTTRGGIPPTDPTPAPASRGLFSSKPAPSTSTPNPPTEPSTKSSSHHGLTSLLSKAKTTLHDKAHTLTDKASALQSHLPTPLQAGITAATTQINTLAHNLLDTHTAIHTTLADAHDALHERILQLAIPPPTTFKQRFGHLGNLIADDGAMTQWNVTYTVDKFCLDGSFTIDFFIGDFVPEQGSWVLDHHLAGQSSVFASDRQTVEDEEGEGGCENCRTQRGEGLVYGDTVGLTEALLVYVGSGEVVHGFGIRSLRGEEVVPFLRRNLHWRVVNARGEDVARERVGSLKVGVFSEVVRLPREVTDLPRFEGRRLHYEITQGRPNGLNPGEEF